MPQHIELPCLAHINDCIQLDAGTVFYRVPRRHSLPCAILHGVNAYAPQAALAAFAADHELTINVQRRFEVLAQTNPGATAIRSGGARLTYGELDEQADGLAVLLQQAGIAPGLTCAICLAPSMALARAALAVLKAGAAAVVLDPAAEPARLAAALRHSGATLALCAPDAALPGNMPRLHCAEDGAGLPLAWPREYPTHRLSPAYAAAPGAGADDRPWRSVSHLAAIDRLLAIQALSPIGHGEAVLLHHAQPCSPFPWDVIWPLSHGAMLLIPAPADMADSQDLRRLLARERVAAMHATPALFGHPVRPGPAASGAGAQDMAPLRALFHHDGQPAPAPRGHPDHAY